MVEIFLLIAVLFLLAYSSMSQPAKIVLIVIDVVILVLYFMGVNPHISVKH